MESNDSKSLNTSLKKLSINGLEPQRLYMFKEELEEALNEPLTLPELTTDEDDEDNSILFDESVKKCEELYDSYLLELNDDMKCENDSNCSKEKDCLNCTVQEPVTVVPKHSQSDYIQENSRFTPTLNPTRENIGVNFSKSNKPHNGKIQCTIGLEDMMQTPIFKQPHFPDLSTKKNRYSAIKMLREISFRKDTACMNNRWQSPKIPSEMTKLDQIPYLRSSNKFGLKSENKIFNEHSNKENVNHKDYPEENVNDFEKVEVPCTIEKFIKDKVKTIVVKNIEYVVLNMLGRGGSSVVYHVYDFKNKCERAIKKVNLEINHAAVAGYINEVKLLERLEHCDRIIKLYDYEIVKSDDTLYLVLEKGELDLSTILKKLDGDGHLPMYVLVYYWMEMLYAVKQIHDNGVIHSDLKPANFLKASNGQLKLIDFGISSKIQSDMTSIIKTIPIGSFNYISPEALRNNNQETPEYRISYKSDIWSLGCILYQLVYRKTPFQDIGNVVAKLRAVMDPHQKIDFPEAGWMPRIVISTIQHCLQYDMKSRPSVHELIEIFESMYH